MTLLPIAVADQVIEEYRDYLDTEFRARDEGLRQALKEALDRQGFLAQEPYFQAHRPFMPGKKWTELGLDGRLAGVLAQRTGTDRAYLHQSEAIGHLLGPEASPLVVTTGTGSGKSECFLLPVIQNAIADASRFSAHGLTAILIYPMNALANDQEQRIRDYLGAAGHSHVRVARYDRTTPEAERKELRDRPPRILLTNYIMLEYLLVRPADRDPLFKGHRCRFVVLDEVHSYRGSLGANIALLFRRLVAHLKAAASTDSEPAPPELLPIATSATIRSIDELGRSPEEIRQLCDRDVQDFLAKLTGYPAERFKVVGAEWVLYHRHAALTEPAEDDEQFGLVGTSKQMQGRQVFEGSFDPATCSFSKDATAYTVPATLAPGRGRCLVCGGTAGNRAILTPVALGTSAAVRVLAEGLVEGLAAQNATKPGRRQGAAAHLCRQPARRGPPGSIHHVFRQVRPDATQSRRGPE